MFLNFRKLCKQFLVSCFLQKDYLQLYSCRLFKRPPLLPCNLDEGWNRFQEQYLCNTKEMMRKENVKFEKHGETSNENSNSLYLNGPYFRSSQCEIPNTGKEAMDFFLTWSMFSHRPCFRPGRQIALHQPRLSRDGGWGNRMIAALFDIHSLLLTFLIITVYFKFILLLNNWHLNQDAYRTKLPLGFFSITNSILVHVFLSYFARCFPFNKIFMINERWLGLIKLQTVQDCLFYKF